MSDESLPVRLPPRLASLTLTPFPSIATKLLALFADDASNLSSIAACIATDVTLSARLIKRANAADQPHYCDIRDVLQATVTLGLDRTREVSLATALATYARYAFQSSVLRPCWDHTLACAVIASKLARLWGLRPLECYTTGLFHDIGRLALLTAYPYEYELILKGSDGEPEVLIAAEAARFGMDHTAVGSWLASRWCLPESIVEAIARHHERIDGSLEELTVIKVACRMADLLEFAVTRSSKRPELGEITEALPEWTRKQVAADLKNIRDAVAIEVRVFDNESGSRSALFASVEESSRPQEGVRDKTEGREIHINLPFLGVAFALAALAASVAVLWVQH